MTAAADDWMARTRVSYDTVAESYAEYMRDALGRSPFLRGALEACAEAVLADGGVESGGVEPGGGQVADVGCGPGHVTAHLRSLGVDAFGIDLSPAMVSVARRSYPEVRFEVGSMTGLDLADSSLAGVVAFWSLVHLPDSEVPRALTEFARVVRPGGSLLLGFHAGSGSRLKTEGYGGHPMDVRVYRRSPELVTELLDCAGFVVSHRLLLALDSPQPGAVLFARRGARVPGNPGARTGGRG